jgi:hypothetical protein
MVICCLNYFYNSYRTWPLYLADKSLHLERKSGQNFCNHNDIIVSQDSVGTNTVIFCYVLGTEAVRVENRGSILRDFVAGKSSMAFEASILIHFIHKSALYVSALLKSSIVSL